MNDRFGFLELIEALRTDLQRRVFVKGSFTDPEVVELSQLLDRVMNEYHASLKEKISCALVS